MADLKEANGQHVRWINRKTGYSAHGTFFKKTQRGKCLVLGEDGKKHKLDSADLEWYSEGAYPLRPLKALFFGRIVDI